ncbi:MAG TPA: hypothetical protein VN840_14390 [Streptosporangiaceae bacterium]|nr:hypothetical protein [Streptosporangiaceae bacterium]
MLSSSWLAPVVATALVVAPSSASAGAHAGAPGRAAEGQEGRAAPGVAWRIATGAVEPAPLVTDVVRAGTARHGPPAPPVSHAMARANAIRQAAALRYLRHARPAAARELAGTQQSQIRNYFCGPATVSEMLAQMQVTLPQQAAARELGTTPAGTDWSNNHGYPVPRVLNAHQKLRSYVAVGLPWTPTAAQIRTFEIDLVTDINHGTGVPIAGNAYEVPGGPHLVGHPPGQEIMHWFDIRGYAQSGAITDYEDSVHGAPSIGWSSAVPAYSSLTSATIVYIVGARGYIW